MNRKLIKATDTMAEYGLMLLVWLFMFATLASVMGLIGFVACTAIAGFN